MNEKKQNLIFFGLKITTIILTHHPNPILGYKAIKPAPHVWIHWKTKNLSKISLRTKTIATNWASSSTLKNPKYSFHSKASEIINEQNHEDLGFAAGAEQVQQLLDSLVYRALWVGVSTGPHHPTNPPDPPETDRPPPEPTNLTVG